MEEIRDTTHEYGQRANGVLSSLDKFDSLSVLNLAIVYLELQSSFLGHCRGKIRLCQKLLSLQIWHTKAEFNKLYESCVSLREGKSGKPVLPRYRRAPARLDRFERPEDYYRVQYYEATAKKNAIRKPIRTSQVKASR